MKMNLMAALFGLGIAAQLNAQQPPPLQLNTPYNCGNNVIVVVKNCAMKNGTEVCSLVKGPANGPLGDEISLPKAQAAAIGLICPPQGSASQAAARTGAGGRMFNPPYLSEMPSVERVLAGMKTNDPHETALRQVWAFYELTEIIKTLSGDREFRGLLPDEQKIMGDYQVAQYKVGQEADKAFPNNKPSEDLTYHFGRWDPRFGYKGIDIWQFLSEGLQSQFAQIVGKDNARYAAMRAEQKRIAAQGVSANPQPVGAQPGMRNDAGSIAMRKCVESGRSDMECMGEGMKVGLADLMGGGDPTKAIAPEGGPGLRLSGVYSAGNVSLGFDESATFVHCGPQIPISVPYSVRRNGQQLLVSVDIPALSKPLVLTYRADGKLAGPGMVELAGQVPAGGAVAHTSTQYEAQTQTTMQTRQIDAAEAQNYAGTDAVHQNGMEYSVTEPVSTTSYNPVPVTTYSVPTKTKIEQCDVGVLPATGSNVKISAALTQMFGTQASKAANTAPGLRLAGTYAGAGGFKAEFRDDSVTLECGEAHSADVYSVFYDGNRFEVKVQNGAVPFSLALQPNGTLVGSGTVDVAGRRIVATSSGDPHSFVRVNARCMLGTLTPTQ
jgi:hypothetical protein